MSLASPYQEHYYVADGVTTSFSFGEYFTGLSQAYVKCIIYFGDGTNCVPTFTVDMTTGFVTIVTLTKPDGTVLTVPPAGSIVRVFRDTPEQQNVTASQLQNYTAKQLERIFDSVVAMIQEVSYSDLHKTIRLTETQRDVSVEQLTEEKDQGILYWDFESRTLKATDYGQDEVVKSETVDRLLYLQPEGKIYFIPKGSTTPISIGSVSLHNDLGGRNAPDCHPESAITGLREHLQELRDKDIEIEEDVQIALNRSQEAKDTADEAKETAEYAQTIAEEAKTIAGNAEAKSDLAITKSESAFSMATESLAKSDTALANSEYAVETSDTANAKSDAAVVTSDRAEDKADQAVTTSQEALASVQSAVEAAEQAVEAAEQATEAAERAEQEIQTYDGRITEAQNNASEALSKVDAKQDKLTAGNGIDIEDDTISTDTQFVITEDMFDIAFDSTKGVAPYSTSYGYTNITIHEDAGVKWVEGAMYSFVLNTKVATSANRNVRVRIGESGDWKPVMVTSSIASGSSVFVKAVNSVFFYKTTYQANGALHCLYDTNTTYTINYSIDAGQQRAGTGAYAVSRYSLIMEKPDGTWEKITDPTKNYTTATSKTVNKRGFLLNQIKYYNYTTNYANGALISASYVYSKSASANGSYSFNCGTAPGWAIGTIIYLVGTVSEEDGLFYLDETQWWATSLPTTNDGKLYIQLGVALSATDSTFSFWDDRPILYYDNGIKLYGGNGGGKVESVNGKDGIVVLTGEDISADVSDLTDTIQGHLQALHDNIKDIELFKFPNATIIGSPTIDHGQVSGFTANDYLQFPFIVDLHNQPFIIDFCFTTGNNVTTQQNILDSQFGLALAIKDGKGLMAISHNGTSWAGAVTGTLAIQPNTTYYARLSWNRINYKTELSTDGKTYVSDMNFGSTQSPYPRTMFIGGCSGSVIGHTAHPFGGTINMNYAYLTVAGNVIWQGMDDAGLSTRADVSLDNLDAFGQAKFDAKQNKLIAGENITIDEATNTISATGGGSADIDNTTITTNANQQIQAVAVIDQNTGIAKTWTGTMAEYEAIVTKDPETEYIITDDIGGSATVIGEITEDINDLKEHTVIEFQAPTAANNYTWYRKYADGWVEQGGYIAANGTTYDDYAITLPILMADTHYFKQKLFHKGRGDNSGFSWAWMADHRSGGPDDTTSVSYFCVPSNSYVSGLYWEVKGMAA